jgi:WD40-like Beta Propeller Repeat
LQRQIFAVDMSGHLRMAFRSVGGVTIEDIAPDGSVLMTRDEQRAGMMAEARGATRERDLSWHDWSLPQSIAPGDDALLFDEQGEQSGPNYTVAMRDLRGSPPVALGEGMAGGLSPDGKWAAATVSYDQLLLLPTGAGTVKRLERGDIERYGPGIDWTPDGRQILFSANQAGHAARCFLESVNGGGPRPVTPEGMGLCHISPDGKLIAATAGKESGVELYRIDGGAPRAVPGMQPGEGFTWTSDPHFLYVFNAKVSPVKVFRLNIDTGQRLAFKEITLPDSAGICGMTHLLFSPDGRAYVFGYVQLLSDLYLVRDLK